MLGKNINTNIRAETENVSIIFNFIFTLISNIDLNII